MAKKFQLDRIDDNGDLIEFRGFSPEAYAFLKQLKRNNRREWFKPRKMKYEELLQKPMHALMVEVRDAMKRIDPKVVFNPKKAVKRVYRDVRFSEDKSPYK